MKIAVFCASSMPRNEHHAVLAREMGNAIARHGDTLIYGASNLGLMGILSTAALMGGAEVVGVIPSFFSEEVIHSQQVTRLVKVGSMSERKDYILSEADVFVALPGGIGTIDEIAEVMVANQLGQIDRSLWIVNQDGFFDPFIMLLEEMQQEGVLQAKSLKNMHIANTFAELETQIGWKTTL